MSKLLMMLFNLPNQKELLNGIYKCFIPNSNPK